MGVRFYDYSVAKNYQYENKSPCVTLIDNMIKPFADVFGSRVVNVSKMEIGLMAPTTKKILYIVLLIAVLPYTLFCAICLLIKYIAEPPSKVLEILRLQMKKRESEITDFIKNFQFEEALDLFEESKELINLFSQLLVRKEFRKVLRDQMQKSEDAKKTKDIACVLESCSKLDILINPKNGNLARIGLKQSEVDFIRGLNIIDRNYEWALGLIRDVDPFDFEKAESICKLCMELDHKQKILSIYLNRVISQLFRLEDIVGIPRIYELLYNVMGVHYLISEGNVFETLLTGVLRVADPKRYVRNVFKVILGGLLDREEQTQYSEASLSEVKLCKGELERYATVLSSIKEHEPLELVDVDYFDMAFMVDVGGLGGLKDFVVSAIKACEERADNPTLAKQLCEVFAHLWGVAVRFVKAPEVGQRRQIFTELSGLNLNHGSGQCTISPSVALPLDHEKLKKQITQELDDQLIEDAQGWLCMVQSVFQQAVDVYKAGGTSVSGLVTDIPEEIQKALRNLDHSMIP